MNDKILVEVYVPLSRKAWDVWLPDDMRMGDVSRLLDGFAEELSGGLYATGGTAVLCDRDTGLVYNVNDRVCDTGIVNGTRLMLL